MVHALIALPAIDAASINQLQAAVPALQPIAVFEEFGAIVDIPQSLLAIASAVAGVVAVSDSAVPTNLPVPPIMKPWLNVWNKFVSQQYQSMVNSRPSVWLPAGLGSAAPVGTPPPPETLTQNVALGVVKIDGPGSAKLSLNDSDDIGLGVYHAIEHLYRNAPNSAHLVFFVETRTVTLTVDPNSIPGSIYQPTTQQQEDRERLWRDPALQAMGFQPGFAGITDYRNALMARPWWGGTPQKAVIILVTKYNTANLAYAALGRAVLNLPQIDVDPGRNHLDRVTAHELCHLFDAPDEYVGCNAFQTFGPFHTVNGNCVANPLATLGQLPCLMAATSDDLCVFSKAHVGWTPFP